MGSKKTTKQTSNSTQTVAPPTWTEPAIRDMAARVQAAAARPVPVYEGNFMAVPDAAGVNDVAGRLTASADQASTLSNWLQGQTMNAMPTSRYDVGTGMDLQPAINAAIHPVFKQLTDQILPGIKSSALDAGAYSGDRAMSVLPTEAINNSNESAQRIAAQLGYEDYQARENRRLQAYGIDTGLETDRLNMLPNLIDTALRASAGGASLAGDALNTRTQANQAQITNDVMRHDYAVRQPYEGMDIATQLLQALSGNYGTTTGNSNSTTVEKTGGLGPIVQGLAGIASMAAGMGAFGGMGGLVGGAAGAAGGQGMAGTMASAGSTFSNPWAPRTVR